jgi:Reverse transcriptase (RNA-dependent DNA polymerase)
VNLRRYTNAIIIITNDPRRRWSEIPNILHLTTNHQIRSHDDCTQLSNGFATYFVEKIRRIKVAISSRLGNSFEEPLQLDIRHATQMFTDIAPPSTDEIYKLIRSTPAKSSPWTKYPRLSSSRVPMRLVTLSFREGKIPVEYTHAPVTLLLKKEGIDADSLVNYRPISNLHTISKIVERVYMPKLAAHVRISPNYNRFQSTLRRGHSTETAHLRMLYDVYCAADNGSRTGLLQLNLSSAFDTLLLLLMLTF